MKLAFLSLRHQLLLLALAALLALGVFYAPVVMDGIANSQLVDSALACGPPSGGC